MRPSRASVALHGGSLRVDVYLAHPVLHRHALVDQYHRSALCDPVCSREAEADIVGKPVGPDESANEQRGASDREILAQQRLLRRSATMRSRTKSKVDARVRSVCRSL